MCADMRHVVTRLDKIVAELDREYINRNDDLLMCDVPAGNPMYALVARIKGCKEFAAAAAQILREDYAGVPNTGINSEGGKGQVLAFVSVESKRRKGRS